MSQLTFQLPDTLYHQLIRLAENEGVSLDQYIVYALTRQVVQTYTVYKVPDDQIKAQQQELEVLLQRLGQCSPLEIATILAEREVVNAEEELSPEIISRLQQRIIQQSMLNVDG